MNYKDKLIKKLVDVGKKYRILVYPTLIMIAIISAISHTVYWGRGNGKKLVASIAIVALLITQSLFQTSSANIGEDMPVTGIEQEEDIEVSNDIQLDNNDLDDNDLVNNTSTELQDDDLDVSEEITEEQNDDLGDNSKEQNDDLEDDEQSEENTIVPIVGAGAENINSVAYNVVFVMDGVSQTVNTANLTVSDNTADLSVGIAKNGWVYGSDQGLLVSGPYFDNACTNSVSSGDISSWDLDTCDISGNTVNLYYKATRTSCVVNISSDGTTISKS